MKRPHGTIAQARPFPNGPEQETPSGSARRMMERCTLTPRVTNKLTAST